MRPGFNPQAEQDDLTEYVQPSPNDTRFSLPFMALNQAGRLQ
jgi:hypothetical protein